MKALPILAAYCTWCFILSCEGQSSRSSNMFTSAGQSNVIPVNHPPQSPYELHGIIDPGMNHMVAFALQTPRAWNMQQSFTRAWNGSTPINQVYIKLISPDQQSMIEFFPSTPYYFSDGPMSRNMRETARAYGMPQQQNKGEMAPVAPLDYIKRILLPQLAQRGIRISMTGEKNLPTKQTAQNTQAYYAYVDGSLQNGKKVRVDCMMIITTTNLNGELYYNWQVLPSLIMSPGNLDENYMHVMHARNTFMENPSWQQKNSQLVRNGNIANNEINKRNAEVMKDYRDHQQRTYQQITENRNSSQDKRNESFRDVIGGQAKYESQETGERVKLADQYNHVYRDRQGNYFGSNEAVDHKQFDWEELQRLETKNY